MKKNLLCIFILQIIFSSCNFSFLSDTEYSNEQQQVFNQYLDRQKEIYKSLGNEIQEKEFLIDFEKNICHIVDSLGLFMNFEGKISNIQTEQVGDTTLLHFLIVDNRSAIKKSEYSCQHKIHNDSIQTDYIYNAVKKIDNHDVVFFNGFIMKIDETTISYAYGKPGDELNLFTPNYNFCVLDIGTIEREETLSKKMYQLFKQGSDGATIIKETITKEFSEQELGKDLEKNIEKIVQDTIMRGVERKFDEKIDEKIHELLN